MVSQVLFIIIDAIINLIYWNEKILGLPQHTSLSFLANSFLVTYLCISMYFLFLSKFIVFISEVNIISLMCIFMHFFFSVFFKAKRCSIVEIDEPWGNFAIERSMPSLKFYHDLTFGMYFFPPLNAYDSFNFNNIFLN